MSGERERPACERRHAARYDPSELAEPVFVVGSRMVNIGALGLMLDAPVPLATDSSVRLHLVVGEYKAAVDAIVRSCVPRAAAGGSTWGVGVEFERLSEPARERLERALVSRRRGTA